MQCHIERATCLALLVFRAMQAAAVIALSAECIADPGSLSPLSPPCTDTAQHRRGERKPFSPTAYQNCPRPKKPPPISSPLGSAATATLQYTPEAQHARATSILVN